jgi:mannose-1-phosphate guanylyltransferase
LGSVSCVISNNVKGWINFDYQDDLGNHFKQLKYRPTLPDAEKFFTDKNYIWNLGYFVTTPKFLWSLFERYAGDLHVRLNEIYEAADTPGYPEVLARVYPQIEKISFDNAILEKMDVSYGRVLSVDIGWSDIGAWEALKEALSNSEEENVTKGKVMIEDSSDSLVFNYTNQLVVGIDLAGYLVINTDDVVLVCPKDSVPKIKKLVESLSGTEHESLT